MQIEVSVVFPLDFTINTEELKTIITIANNNETQRALLKELELLNEDSILSDELREVIEDSIYNMVDGVIDSNGLSDPNIVKSNVKDLINYN